MIKQTSVARRVVLMAGMILGLAGPVLGGPGSGGGNGPSFGPGGGAKDSPKAPESAPGQERRPERTAEGKIDLRPRWEVGQVIKYVMVQESESLFPGFVMPGQSPAGGGGGGAGGGAPEKAKNIQEIGFSLRVKSVDKDSGVATVDMVYDRVKISLDGMGMKVEFDSAKPKAPASKKPATTPAPGGIPGMPAMPALEPEKLLEQHMAGMVGQTMTLTIDRSGKITSVSGGEKLDPTGMLAALGGGGGGAGTPQQGGGLFGPISSSGGSDGFASVGESWTNVDRLSVGPLGDMDMRTTHRLKSARGGMAEVTFEGRVDGSSSGGKPATAQLETASNKGSYSWDYAKGQLARMRLEQRVAQALPQSPGGGGGGGSQNAQAVSTTVMTVERVR